MREIVNFDEFFEESWDYVSKYVVTDDFWESNQEFIRETTFDIFEVYRKRAEYLTNGKVIEKLSVKDCGKMLEVFFSMLNKYSSNIIFPNVKRQHQLE